jgi:hypothetical protein
MKPRLGWILIIVALLLVSRVVRELRGVKFYTAHSVKK